MYNFVQAPEIGLGFCSSASILSYMLFSSSYVRRCVLISSKIARRYDRVDKPPTRIELNHIYIAPLQ